MVVMVVIAVMVCSHGNHHAVYLVLCWTHWLPVTVQQFLYMYPTISGCYQTKHTETDLVHVYMIGSIEGKCSVQDW